MSGWHGGGVPCASLRAPWDTAVTGPAGKVKRHKSLVVIFVHGTIEISAIIIAGAAGLILGKSWMFPGTFKRMDSLKIGAKDSLKIVMGLVPFFLVAAFLEGFITRHTEMPLWLSISILAVSVLLIAWYFVIYPKQLKSRIETENLTEINQ